MRTIDDFVDDMILNGRTPAEIWAVARNTRWASYAEEAREEAERRLENLKNLGNS